ncbi:MAG: asparagine synthase (glutamine-hydrolyzing) [bacterium]|nr:asparagine synthase (glutamine-hydrolyzing) [bacterium]
MFAVGLWDEKEKKLILARDRLGKKPLHYLIENGRLLFGSEIKSILQDKEVKREINYEAINDFLTFLCIPAPKTIFKGIFKLPPGHILVCTPDKFFVREYWDFNFSNSQGLIQKEEYYINKLIPLLRDSVKCRLMSEVPLGAFLSGGIDSSCVVALMSQLCQEPVITSSIGFEEDAFNELNFAQIIATLFKTSHYEDIVRPDSMEILPKLIHHFDEPFADSSAIPTYYVSQAAKKRVTVALSGDGGDEFFAGYTSYYDDIFEDRVRNIIPTFIKRSLRPLLNHYPDFLPAKSYLSNVCSSFEEAFMLSRSTGMPEIQQKIYSQEFISKITGYDSFSVLEPYLKRSKGWDTLSRAQYIDAKTYLPDDILVKVDRMSMAVSLEVRAPFLDHKLIEFVGSIPSNLRLHNGILKYILKRSMEGILPQEILKRKKKGFSVPISMWFKKELKTMMEEILFSPRASQRGYFNPYYVRMMWEDHQKGIKDFSSQFWCLLMLELWERAFIEREELVF